MVIMNFGVLLSVRNRVDSLFSANPLWGPRANWRLFASMTGSLLVAIVVLYGPGINSLFGTSPVPGKYWGIPFAFAAAIIAFDELRKHAVRKWPQGIVAKAAW